MTIPALGVSTGQAVQDCGLGMFKIGKAQDGLGLLAIDSGARLLLHGLWPPCHQTMIRPSLAVLSGLPVIGEQCGNAKVEPRTISAADISLLIGLALLIQVASEHSGLFYRCGECRGIL